MPEVIHLLDQAISFFSTHFRNEEQFLAEHRFANLDRHAKVHREFNNRTLSIRSEIQAGREEAMLDASDLLQLLHSHVDAWDRPAFESILAGLGDNATIFEHNELARLRRQRQSVNSFGASGSTQAT